MSIEQAGTDTASEHYLDIQQFIAKALLSMKWVFALPLLDFSSLNLPF